MSSIGASSYYINNVGGLGALTGNNPGDGIKVLQVDGTSDLVVLLQGGVLMTPLFKYTLVKNPNDGSWYLQSQANSADEADINNGNNTDNSGNGGTAIAYMIPVLNNWSLIFYAILVLLIAFGFFNARYKKA